VRAQLNTAASTEPVSEFKPSLGFKAPEPQKFAIKEGWLGSIFIASLRIPFRLDTGIFVLWYLSADSCLLSSIPPRRPCTLLLILYQIVTNKQNSVTTTKCLCSDGGGGV
jgi:hypothetical protein